jgi:multiple sugar transport system substrate-binding protein
MTTALDLPAARAATPPATRASISRRRALGGALGATMCAPIAAACDVRGSGSAPNPAAVSGRVELWFDSVYRFDQDLGGTFVKEFGERYPQVQIIAETILSTSPSVPLVTNAAAGTLPDFVTGVPPHHAQELGAQGILAPLEGYMKASRTVRQADIWPTLLTDLTFRGKQFAMPHAPDVRLNFIGNAVLGDSGLNPSRLASTWEEMEDHVRRITRVANGQMTRAGFVPFQGSGSTNVWSVPFWQLGGEYLSPDGEKVTIDNEKGLQALEWLKRIHDLQGGYQATQELATRSGGNANTRLIQGVTGYLFTTFYARKGPEFVGNPTFQWSYAPWPLPKGGKRANHGGSPSAAITTGSKSPEATWRFMEFLCEEPQNLRFAIRYDRIPVRIKTAESAAFQQNDPFLKVSVEEMRYRKWQISAPGGSEITSSGHVGTMVTDVMSGKRSARDALKDTQSLLQQILDKNKR